MKNLFLYFILASLNYSYSYSQEIGEIRELELILGDIPSSGGAKQANFITLDTTEIYSFNDMNWLDKHVHLYDFFHKYRDICTDTSFHFMVTMIYIPKESYEHKRYEGYIPTGRIVNTWVLTSIIEIEEKQ
jgi:hypothetical protein